MDLVDEEQGALPGPAAQPALVEGPLQVGDAGEHRRQRDEDQPGPLRQQPGDRGLAHPGRAPEDQRGQAAPRQHPRQRAGGPSRWSCPTTSSSVFGRSRSASGRAPAGAASGGWFGRAAEEVLGGFGGAAAGHAGEYRHTVTRRRSGATRAHPCVDRGCSPSMPWRPIAPSSRWPCSPGWSRRSTSRAAPRCLPLTPLNLGAAVFLGQFTSFIALAGLGLPATIAQGAALTLGAAAAWTEPSCTGEQDGWRQDKVMADAMDLDRFVAAQAPVLDQVRRGVGGGAEAQPLDVVRLPAAARARPKRHGAAVWPRLAGGGAGLSRASRAGAAAGGVHRAGQCRAGAQRGGDPRRRGCDEVPLLHDAVRRGRPGRQRLPHRARPLFRRCGGPADAGGCRAGRNSARAAPSSPNRRSRWRHPVRDRTGTERTPMHRLAAPALLLGLAACSTPPPAPPPEAAAPPAQRGEASYYGPTSRGDAPPAASASTRRRIPRRPRRCRSARSPR